MLREMNVRRLSPSFELNIKIVGAAICELGDFEGAVLESGGRVE